MSDRSLVVHPALRLFIHLLSRPFRSFVRPLFALSRQSSSARFPDRPRIVRPRRARGRVGFARVYAQNTRSLGRPHASLLTYEVNWGQTSTTDLLTKPKTSATAKPRVIARATADTIVCPETFSFLFLSREIHNAVHSTSQSRYCNAHRCNVAVSRPVLWSSFSRFSLLDVRRLSSLSLILDDLQFLILGRRPIGSLFPPR